MKSTSVPPCEISIARRGESTPPLDEKPVVIEVTDRFDAKPPSRRGIGAYALRLPKLTLPGTPQQWADALWYLGHVMSVGSLVSRYSLPAAAVLVGVGQIMVIASRPLGRLPAATKAHEPAADDSV